MSVFMVAKDTDFRRDVGVACAPMTLPEAALPLAEWESFYVIIGTSAAALTGLTFVVIAVVADAGPRATTPLGIATFITPTIVHFCGALVISSILSAPWHEHLPVQIGDRDVVTRDLTQCNALCRERDPVTHAHTHVARRSDHQTRISQTATRLHKFHSPITPPDVDRPDIGPRALSGGSISSDPALLDLLPCMCNISHFS